MLAACSSLAARRAMRQGERSVQVERIGISARSKAGEQRLNHEQIGRENRDPASDV